MATQYVTFCTTLKPGCAFVPNAPVILCLQDSALIVQPDDYCTVELTTIEATICAASSFQQGCQNWFYQYTFAYDDTQIIDTARGLVASDIISFICEDCLTTWIEESIGDEVTVTLDEIAGTVTITAQHGCPTTFSVAGGGGPTVDWHVLGNSGTIDGTDFCGTIDDVPFAVRTNNLRSRYTVPNEYTSTSVGPLDAPNILDGNVVNSITDAVAATISGGGSYAQAGTANFISGTGSTPTTIAFGSTIGGGAGNRIEPDGPPDFTYMFSGTPQEAFDYGGYSTISGGGDNTIAWGGEPSALGAGFHVIGGGQTNTIENAGGCATIGGGYINFITYDLTTLDPDLGNAIAGDVLVGGVSNIISSAEPDGGPMETDALGANFIGSGIFNEVENGWQSSIVGGWDNLVSARGTEYGGVTVMPGPLSYNFIGGGAYNVLDVTQNSTIVGGLQSKIFGEADSLIAGGMRNLIFATVPALPQTPGESSYDATYPSPTVGAFNAILGGYANVIEDGFCSTILGGAALALGSASAGYQSPVSRTFGFSEGDIAFPYFPFQATNFAQVDLTAFSSIFYVGDADIWVGNTDATARKVKFFSPNVQTNYGFAPYSSFEAPNQLFDINYILPAVKGTAGQVLTIASEVGTVVTLEWA